MMMITNSFMCSNRWLLAYMFLNILAFVTAQNPFSCTIGRFNNYTSNSIYDASLNTLLSSVSVNISDEGFYNASFGQNPNRANIIVLCRGDTQLESCRRCVETASTEMLNSCPNQKQAVIYYEFCTLRHSNITAFRILENIPGFIMFNTENTTSPQFLEDRRTLLEDLIFPAASGGSLRKVAAGNRTTSENQTIYALVQCTPDLSSDDCTSCLTEAAVMPQICMTKIGCRILRPSCNIRYETRLFYNDTRLQEFLVPATVPAPPPLLPPPPPPRGKKDDNTTRTIVIVVVSVAGCLLLAVCLCVLLKKRIKQKLKEAPKNDITTSEFLQYDFGTLRLATNDFSDTNKLGEGGFGVVYKGILHNGQEIAVKRLSVNSVQGDSDFKNEVLLVSKLQHRNLVRLLGFSIEGNEKILVYEFIENASLDQFIFDPTQRSNLDWEKRFKIIVGVARGLLYLHEDSRINIIHRDLKASNVLLDGEMNPKIADFGTARLCTADETQANTKNIVGTYGYMSPEYAMHGQFSVKSDVFSFGVLVLEIISGQKNNSFRNGETIEDLISSAWKYWSLGTSINLIDPVLRAGSGSMRDMMRCIHIGLLCVQENIAKRPTMTSVVLMFNSFSMTLPVPSEPAYFVCSGYDSDNLPFQEYNSRDFESTKSAKTNKSDQSTNDASISEFLPR